MVHSSKAITDQSVPLLQMNNIDSVLADTAQLTPEKLALMKLDSDAAGDIFSDSTSRVRGHAHRSSAGGQALTRLRHSSSMSRQTSAFMASHRHKMALELTTQAESHFSSFMDLIASASKEASSFKEYWTKLLAERESFEQEREQLLMRVEEVTEMFETQQRSENDHSRELSDRKRHFDKIVLELSGAMTSLKDERQKISERESELEQVHKDLTESRTALSRLQQNHDTVRAESERLVFKLTAADAERERARDDAEKYRVESRTARREQTELRARLTESTLHLETANKEKIAVGERLRVSEKERDEYQFDRERLQEELRRTTLRAEEAVRELLETKERTEHVQRELNRAKESLRSTESERDDQALSIERLRVEIRDKAGKLEDIESRYTELLVKLEQTKRDVSSKQDRLLALESDNVDVRQQLESRSEEHRLVVVERDQLRDDLEGHRRDAADHGRQLATLQDSLKRSEATVSDIRNETFQANERVTLAERERDNARHRHSSLESELKSVKGRLEFVSGELKLANEHRDRATRELAEFKQSYDEVTETVSEWKDDSDTLQVEIEHLRKMLLETRQQKERAISARNTADRERDDIILKYEEKCRELERYDEDRASHYHAHAHAYSNGHSTKRTSTSRVFSQNSSGTQLKSSGGHENGYGDSVAA